MPGVAGGPSRYQPPGKAKAANPQLVLITLMSTGGVVDLARHTRAIALLRSQRNLDCSERLARVPGKKLVKALLFRFAVDEQIDREPSRRVLIPQVGGYNETPVQLDTVYALQIDDIVHALQNSSVKEPSVFPGAGQT